LTITGGFGDPFETGKVFGYYAILQGIFPSFMSHITFNPDFSKKLKRAGYLRRDPREVERKKPGLKKARRAPQWRKR